MPVEVSYPHVVKREDEPARLERLPRVRVAQIVIDYRELVGSVDAICAQYPHLRPAEVHSAMAYYFDHAAEIDAEIDEERRAIAEAERAHQPSPWAARMRAEDRIP